MSSDDVVFAPKRRSRFEANSSEEEKQEYFRQAKDPLRGKSKSIKDRQNDYQRKYNRDLTNYNKSKQIKHRSPKEQATKRHKGEDLKRTPPRKSRWEQEDNLEQTTEATKTLWDIAPTETVTEHQAEPSVYMNITPQQLQMLRLQKEIEARNKPWTESDLQDLLPIEGFEIVKPPENYKPDTAPTRNINAFLRENKLFQLPDELGKPYEVPGAPTTGPFALPPIKPEDLGYFGKLLQEVDFDRLSYEEQKERRIMEILLKVKCGDAIMRHQALRQVTEHARELGAEALFNQILPLMLSSTLEDQERHLLVKVIDRILYKLDELVRPHVHRILVVIEPMLIEEDFYARVEGREIISSLAKAAGLPTMIATLRQDIDHQDEAVRNTTSRALAVVASALGIPSILPFLRAVCSSKKTWYARHTGVKIVQQIAILIGCSILPHLKSLVQIVEPCLKDEQRKVQTISALAIAALAEASAPYGIEAFESVLKPIWQGIKGSAGKILAAFLKAIGFIIPLMETEIAGAYTRRIMHIVVREFSTRDDDMKKIVLRVLKQCIGTQGISAGYIRDQLLDEFFQCFWQRRNALDRKCFKQLVETSVELALKIGGAEIIQKIVRDLKDDSEPYRKMVAETIQKIIIQLGVSDVNQVLEEQLMDGILYAFQEQNSDDSQLILNTFGIIVSSLHIRSRPYIANICGTITWRLNNRSPLFRMLAADLVSQVAPIMYACGEEVLMGRLSMGLFECLGEEYPEVLGSVIGSIKSIVNVIGMSKMTPPIRDLLPRLAPILRNRHEKVQENVIDLIGCIAERGAEQIPAKEWMRISFELLELLRANKKSIRKATITTYGFIAKAIGPHDVLSTLLNNLKVQERQNRVCTTIAIAIVAETCGPFTVIPALMNEYRVPEVNVQNGVLKSFSFMFEYIGEMSKDYIYALVPLLEDALIDRDLVHRQIACMAVKHLALGVCGLGCEDALIHLLNFIWPNIFETSPHVINSVIEALDALGVALGAGRIIGYLVQGLFHPARKVRQVYWRIYNLLYLSSQDAITMYFPRLNEDKYRRTELELFV